MRDIIKQTCPSFPPLSLSELTQAREAPATREAHDLLAAHIPALHAIQLTAPPASVPFGSTIRIAAWNAERCKYDRASRRLLEAVGAEVTLLSEMDVGMARSGNRHTVRDLTEPLQQGFAFAVEFVELGLGDSREMRWHAGQSNTFSLHGNAIMSRSRLADVFVVPLDEGGTWFKQQRCGSAAAGRTHGDRCKGCIIAISPLGRLSPSGKPEHAVEPRPPDAAAHGSTPHADR